MDFAQHLTPCVACVCIYIVHGLLYLLTLDSNVCLAFYYVYLISFRVCVECGPAFFVFFLCFEPPFLRVTDSWALFRRSQFRFVIYSFFYFVILSIFFVYLLACRSVFLLLLLVVLDHNFQLLSFAFYILFVYLDGSEWIRMVLFRIFEWMWLSLYSGGGPNWFLPFLIGIHYRTILFAWSAFVQIK